MYASTNNKKYAKRFEQERDMNQFVKAVTDNVDTLEWEEYGNKNRNSILEITKLTTKLVEKNGKESPVDSMEVEVLVTFWEKSTVINDIQFDGNDEYFWEEQRTPYIYRNKYIESLRKLQFVKQYVLYNIPLALSNDSKNAIDIDSKFMIYEGDDDYDGPRYTIDELSQLISKYGSSFKK